MPVFDPTLTADKAAATLPANALNASGHAPDTAPVYQTKGYIDARRTHRAGPQPPPELDIVKEFKKQRVRIFNVGPFAHVIPCGSAGTFYIPACPENKPYVEMLTPLHVLEEELYPSKDKKEYKRLQDEGRKMAVDLLGEGRNQDKKQSKRRVGVFIAAGEEPTMKELDDAKAQLHAYASEQVLYMDHLWDRDRKLAYDVFRPETFGACARVLKLTGKEKPWLTQSTPSDNIECPSCFSSVRPDAPICFNCKEVVNEEAYLKIRARRESIAEATAPQPKAKKA